jgi:hypothetical protein
MIIGAMKSGTTTLHHILQQHPEIVTGVRKELNFFRPRIERKNMLPAYEALFPRLDKTRHAFTLDSSTNYTKPGMWDCAPSAIARLPGRKRLIYVLRNPIERIESHVAHNIAQGRWTADDWPKKHVVGVSAYARQLAKFEAVGLLDDILLVDFADLSVDPVGVAYRAHDFLGIPRVRPKSVERRNLRKVNGQVVQQNQLPQLQRLLREDVETLIKRYGFEPAKSWAIGELPRKRASTSSKVLGDSDSASMKPVEDLRYSFGFLIGADKGQVAEHFHRIDFPLPLAVHPRTRIAMARDVAQPLAILGEAVHPDLPHLDLQGIAEHLGSNHLIRQHEIDKLVGRFAVIQAGDRGDWRLQTDAIGMRSVFFSVGDTGTIAGSHAGLVAGAVPGGTKKKVSPFRWGYPGISTPYASVFRLPPNCELSLTKGSLHRFFPKAAIPETGIEEAWDFAFNRAGASIRALAERRKLLVSLTAGLDSRTTLAACRDSWPHLLLFTYSRGVHKHRVDTNVAVDLTKALGLRHELVRYSQHEPDQAMLKVLADNAFTSHQPNVACAYRRRYGEDAYLHIRSNFLELGRSNLFYRFGKRGGFDAPRTGESMGAVYNRAAKLTPERASHVVPAFDHYVAVSDYESTIGKASPWDMYFVEHRMGAWHSGVVLESDLSFDTVVAFNSREVVRHFMGVPQEIRCSSPHLRERLNALMPEVMDIPVNPKRYSRRAAA